jgi:hypothetical protein
MAGMDGPDQDKLHAFPFTHHVPFNQTARILTAHRLEDTPRVLELLAKCFTGAFNSKYQYQGGRTELMFTL